MWNRKQNARWKQLNILTIVRKGQTWEHAIYKVTLRHKKNKPTECSLKQYLEVIRLNRSVEKQLQKTK